jgi:V/A-type H+/Na+-transporting ATPase subunit E
MPYAELLHALDDEVARQSQELNAAAEAERLRLLDEARKAAAAERDAIADQERAQASAKRSRLIASSALERQKEILLEQRRLMDEVRAEVLKRLAATGSEQLSALVDEAVVGLHRAPDELVVDQGQIPRLRAYLEHAHPGWLPVTKLREAQSGRGGVEVRAGPIVYDNTFPARLEKAWPDIEGAAAAALFGAGDAAV